MSTYQDRADGGLSNCTPVTFLLALTDVSEIPEELPEGKEATDEDLSSEDFEEIEEVRMTGCKMRKGWW